MRRSVELIRLVPPITIPEPEAPEDIERAEIDAIGVAMLCGNFFATSLEPGTHPFEVPSIGHNHQLEVEVDDDSSATLSVIGSRGLDPIRSTVEVIPRDKTESVFYGYEGGSESVRIHTVVAVFPQSPLARYLPPRNN